MQLIIYVEIDLSERVLANVCVSVFLVKQPRAVFKKPRHVPLELL